MINVTSSLLSDVLVYKYLAIFIITFLGAFALPLPSGTIVIAASAFSTQGYLNFFAVLLIGILGNIIGDHTNYWLSRRIGVAIFKRLGLSSILEAGRMRQVRGMIEKHPILTIFFSRFMTGIAPTVNVVSGLTTLPYKLYVTFEVLGEITEVSIFALVGFFLGSNWESVDKYSGRLWILFVAGAAGTYLFWDILLRKGKKKLEKI